MENKFRILKSTENQLLRKSTSFKNWRNSVFKRDNYFCQECGSKNDLHPHHIKRFAIYPDLRFEISNGLTLCSKCHGKIHGINFSKFGHYITCLICKIRFRPKSRHLNQKTCGKKCGYVLRNRNGSSKKGRHYPNLQRSENRYCLECGNKFRAIKDFKTRKQKYCSHLCYLKNRWNFTGKKAELLKKKLGN